MFKLEVKTSYDKKPVVSKLFGRTLSWVMGDKHEKIDDPRLFYCFTNIEKSAKGLDAQVSMLSQEMNSRMQNGFGVPPELIRKRDALAAQRNALAAQHRSIIAMINEAEKVA